MAKRVLLVDDNAKVRQELRTLLLLSGDVTVVGEAENGREAVRQAEALRPDVVVMDLEMPVMDGYEAARQIRACCPAGRIVVLTVHGYAAARHKAGLAGVDAFVEKGAPLRVLLETILKETCAKETCAKEKCEKGECADGD